MDTFEFKPTEGFRAGESAGMEVKALESATFEPAAFIEEVGEVEPAEALQVSLEVMIASLPIDTIVESGSSGGEGKSLQDSLPEVRDDLDRVTETSPGSASGDEATPITLPGPSGDAATPITLPGPRGEAVTPFSIPGVEAGLGDVDTLPIPKHEVAADETEMKLEGKQIGIVEVPLPGTGEVGYEDVPERLEASLPEVREPMVGVGAKGYTEGDSGLGRGMPSDASEIDMMPGTIRYGGIPGGEGDMPEGSWKAGSASGVPGLPFDIPDIGVEPGAGMGKGGKPQVIGNVPGGGGKLGSGSGIPDLGIPDMPTSGGFSSSGSGPAVMGGLGGYAEGEDNSKAEEEASKGKGKSSDKKLPVHEGHSHEGKNEQDCDSQATYIQDLLGFQAPGSTATLDCDTKTETFHYDITKTTIMKERQKKSQEPDDSNPRPYTGGSTGPALPEKTEDTGKKLPEADLGFFDAGVVKGEPGDGDDSGRFYGGILGGYTDQHPDSGGARPIDPVRKTEEEGKAEDSAG